MNDWKIILIKLGKEIYYVLIGLLYFEIIFKKKKKIVENNLIIKDIMIYKRYIS